MRSHTLEGYKPVKEVTVAVAEKDNGVVSVVMPVVHGRQKEAASVRVDTTWTVIVSWVGLATTAVDD